MRGANYLLFSDVHLGADLVQHVRPWTVARLKQVARIDRDLAAMLDWYREHRDPERPWRLVIAGDLVDFIGMSIAPLPDSPQETSLTEEEHLHGLGSAGDHAATKMRAVAKRHGLVFDRLASFVQEGHELVLVRGNHDVDFHWEAARRAFVEALVERVPDLATDPTKRAEFESRIEFHPWFYYVEGLLYVEHGHQFDAMCSYLYQLAPVCPEDPKRLSWSISDRLLRSVVRPTPGLSADGHEGMTLVDYLKLAASLGVKGALRLGWRWLSAVANAIRSARVHVKVHARAIQQEHERRMAELATRMRLKVDHLRELSQLWPAPVSGGAVAVLRSVFLDRIVLALAAACVLLLLFATPLPLSYLIPFTVVLITSLAVYFVWSHRQRRQYMDPRSVMRKSARRIAQLMPARYVVMGHTHEPVVEAVDEKTTYVNLGNWGSDDLDGAHAEPPRTHLVLRWIGDELRAEFCRWDPSVGPKPV